MTQPIAIYHYQSLFIPKQLTTMNDGKLRKMCFQGLDGKSWGYGAKRIGIKMPGSITDKISFSGFGFKEQDGTYKIGVRMWLDQGDFVKYIQYDNRYLINQHFVQLINMFQYEYPSLC